MVLYREIGSDKPEYDMPKIRGEFKDVVSGRAYPIDINALSDVGLAIHDGGRYIIVFRDVMGVSMNETLIIMLRPFDATSQGTPDSSLIGKKLSVLIAEWGNPDTIETYSASTGEPKPEDAAAVMTFKSRNRKAFITRNATVLKIEGESSPLPATDRAGAKREEPVTIVRAVELATKEFLKTRNKIEDFRIIVESDNASNEWSISFNPRTIPRPPGGGFSATIKKDSGKLFFRADD
jgi:hypothetical protein